MSFRVGLDARALAQAMPLHLLLDGRGRVRSAGPVLLRLLGQSVVPGAGFAGVFVLRQG